MATILLNKKNFLKWIATQIGDDKVVLIATDISQAELKNRTSEKRIEYSFAADAFKKSDTVRDLMDSETLSCALCITDSSEIAPDFLKDIKP